MFGVRTYQRWAYNRRRMIYRFWDGSQYRRVDPIDIHLQLQSHPRYVADRHLKQIDEGDNEATRITCAAVCEVFNVQPFDPVKRTGLTIGEQLGLLADFYFWLEDQKKSIRHTLTAPSSTESGTWTDSSETTTPAMSDFGSTDSEPTCDMPITFGMQSTPPSEITSEIERQPTAP